MDSKTEEKTSVINQYRAAISVNILALSYGCALGWVSPSIPILSGPDTPLDSPLTKSQASLVASLICIGGLIGTPIFGFISVQYGRRTGLLCSVVPVLISWGVKLTWKTAQGLYLARIFAGLGGAAVFLIVPIYCIEIASLSSRGILGSLFIFGINCGIVTMYIMGACLNYYTILIITLCLPVIAFIFIVMSPETPVYLVKQRKYQKATKALAWLRREPEDSPIIIKALELLKHKNDLSSSCCSSEIEERHLDKTNEVIEISPWQFFITSKPTKNAFAVCFALNTVQCMIGIFAVITFANEIFKETGSNLPPSVNSIIVSVLQLLGSIVASFLMERMGRRILLISTCMIISTSMSIIGFYFFLKEKGYDVSIVGWIPVTALSFVMCTYPMGIGPIPFMLSSETIMVKARGIAEPLIAIWFWILSFLIIQTFNTLAKSLGSYSVFWIFSTFGSLGVIITFRFLPETRGNSFENILDFYSGKRKMNIALKNEKSNNDSF